MVFANVASASESPPEPFHVWTFNENSGRWVNDAANWHQKWQLTDGAVCLKNVPIELDEGTGDMPWLSLNSEKDAAPVKGAKIRFWSPPIPAAVGMRCVSMAYLVDLDSGDLVDYGLSILQHQEK
uniref:MAM domain-containing protein n=1 Tax=Mesocestoides corti TaxID=53468 RepID=A0A5K3F0I5_MESCO